MIKLFNTLSGKKEEFKPIKPWEVSIYTCGPTVYNYAHIWNFRAYLSADTLRRFLSFSWYKIKWVLNITDVDDKTIRDSKEKYPDLNPMEALNKFCLFYENEFFKDLKLLNINKDDFFANPRATEFIDAQQDLVKRIYKAGFAYEIWWSVYFDVKKFHNKKGYWRLVKINFEELQSSWRIESDEYEKEEIADFVLWKWNKPWEPFWDFHFLWKSLPWRPGWHLECSAMEKEILDLPFDIHNWGKDLKFPHHEDEIAQSYAWYWIIPNNFFIHNWHLLVDWEKMAKSKWNFYVLQDLINKWYSPEAIRLSMVFNHYLIDFNLTENWLNAARKNLEYIREFYKNIKGNLTWTEIWASEKIIRKYRNLFIEAMSDDLNTPQAIAHVLEFIKEARGIADINWNVIIKFLDEISFVFWVSFNVEDVEIPKEIEQLTKQRFNAKLDKDFALADKLKAEIESKWYAIKDSREWYSIRKI